MNSIAKLRAWTVQVKGKISTIFVLSTDVPDIGSFFGGYDGNYDNTLSYKQGSLVRVTSTSSVGGIFPTPGVYACISDVDGNGTANMVPQYPAPSSGTIFWVLICFPPRLINICVNGKQQISANSSASF